MKILPVDDALKMRTLLRGVLEAGARDYILKPFNSGQVPDVMRRSEGAS
jgi:CheY-like chemotaxis protein